MTTNNDIQAKVWAALETVGCQCNGMGYITLNVPPSDPNFGKSFKCICQREATLMYRMEKTIKSDALPKDSFNYDFDDYASLEYVQRALSFAKQLTRGWVFDEEKNRSKAGLVLYGPTGCFKTTLMSIVYRHQLSAGKSCGWWNATAFVKRVQATYAKGYDGANYDQIINAVARLQFLVIDDLGSPTRKETLSEDAIEIWYRVLNFREANKLATGFTTNCGKAQLMQQLGPRNYSRLEGLCAFVQMNGQDQRTAVGL